VVDLLFLTSQQRGKADSNFGRSQFRKTERTSGASGLGHSQMTFMSTQVIDRTSHVTIPVDTIQSQIQMSIENEHSSYFLDGR
jgi:hypothetical protein